MSVRLSFRGACLTSAAYVAIVVGLVVFRPAIKTAFQAVAPLWLLPLIRNPSLDVWGQWLAGAVAPLALAWAIGVFFLQRRELTYQRKELSLTRREMKLSREVFSKQEEQQRALAELTKKANQISLRDLVIRNSSMWESYISGIIPPLLDLIGYKESQYPRAGLGPITALSSILINFRSNNDLDAYQRLIDTGKWRFFITELSRYINTVIETESEPFISRIFFDVMAHARALDVLREQNRSSYPSP